jgi:calreticulin
MFAKVALLCVAAVSAEVYFKETFADGEAWKDRWVASDWKKSSGGAGEFKLSAGKFYGDAEADKGIQTSQDARFYSLSSKMTEFSNKDKDLVIQFSVKHEQKIDCGGGYVKILPTGFDPKKFSGDDDYTIMFGPDICGATKRVHVIFNYKGKNLLIKKTIPAETDELTHVYTLIVKPDNTYEVRIDGNKKESGNLADDWDFLKPKKIKDPDQSKPKDWVDEAKIDDPNDKKPEGYDDIPKQIADPEAEKPEDWDDESDGEWEAPQIDNPEYKGEWKAKKIDNPDYKGPWVHPEIDNPEYEFDANMYSYASHAYIGFDLWQVKSGTVFDNIIVTDDIKEAEALLAETYTKNKDAEKKMFDDMEAKKKAEEEAERKKAEEEKKKAEAEDDDDDDDDDDEDEDKKEDKKEAKKEDKKEL